MAERIQRKVDVAVLGAGTAGLAAYRAAKARGKSVVLIEGGAYGTTCARVGCMPSKLLIAAAEAAHAAQASSSFGVHAGSVRVDGKAVLDRVRSERDRFVGFVVEGVDRIDEADKIRGYATFAAPNVLEVGGARVVARSIVIATGSRPVIPPPFQGLGDRLIVNDHVFDWTELPGSVAVIGTGVIGLELGQALSRLGVRTRVFGRGGRVGPLTDPAVRASALAAISRDVPITFDAVFHAVNKGPLGVVVDYETSEARVVETFDYVLVAAGRTPNVDKLSIEHAGLTLDARGVPVFDRRTLQCGSSSVFLAGDVNNELTLLHEAADEGTIAGENAARFPEVVPGHRRSALGIVFTDPNLAIVGSSWAELERQSNVMVGEVSFEDQGRSRVMHQNRGLLRVYADAESGRFLGAEIAGPRAEHIAHLLAWSHQQGLTTAVMLTMPFYHPVIEEGLRTALRDVEQKRRETRVPSTTSVATKAASVQER